MDVNERIKLLKSVLNQNGIKTNSCVYELDFSCPKSIAPSVVKTVVMDDVMQQAFGYELSINGEYGVCYMSDFAIGIATPAPDEMDHETDSISSDVNLNTALRRALVNKPEYLSGLDSYLTERKLNKFDLMEASLTEEEKIALDDSVYGWDNLEANINRDKDLLLYDVKIHAKPSAPATTKYPDEMRPGGSED